MSFSGAKSTLTMLRSVMKSTKYVTVVLQAYVIPSNDAHQSEYIAECDRRREFMSGFTGSLGTAVVTENLAAMWTDGRYFLQAEKELYPDWTLMKQGVPGTPTEGEWLSKVLPSGSYVGVDPFLMSYDAWETLQNSISSAGLILMPVEQNLVDVIWSERPPRPVETLSILPIEYTGINWVDKIKSLREDLMEKRALAFVVTALDDIAWLFNLRGSDVPYNPVFFSYAVITMEEVHLFIDEDKILPVLEEFVCVNGLKFQVHPYSGIQDFVQKLAINSDDKEIKNIWITKEASYALVSLVPKDRLISSVSPIALKKAVKNGCEIKCMRNGHIKDAVALCEFFAWLEEAIKTEEITECSAAKKLEEFRKSQDDYVGLSFETISAVGPNAAMAHYAPEEGKDRILTTHELYLCDSGAQYRDGTTDVTRTVHFGVPTDFEKRCFTRVLKGHIALSSAIFPNLIKGQRIDALARTALWNCGLDYMHGTGHGVGMYLNVHEGPMGISWRSYPNDPGLQEGMILSIEPGYYEDGQFGIRIENLALIVKAKTVYNYKNTGFLTFDPITLVPIQSKLLVPALLTLEEIKWLDDYHQTCRHIVGQILKKEGKTAALAWLEKETLPLA